VKFSYQYHTHELEQELTLEQTDGGGTETVTETETETETDTIQTEEYSEITDPDLLPAECGDVVMCFFNWSTSQCPNKMSELCCDLLADYIEYNCSNRIGLFCERDRSITPLDYFLRTCAVSVETLTRLDMAKQDFDSRVERAFRKTVADLVGVGINRVTVASVTSATKKLARFKASTDETLVKSITKVDTQADATFAQQILRSSSTRFLDELNANLALENSTIVLTRAINTVVLHNNTHEVFNQTSVSFSFSSSSSVSPGPSSTPLSMHPGSKQTGLHPGSKQTGSASTISAVAAIMLACLIVLLL